MKKLILFFFFLNFLSCGTDESTIHKVQNPTQDLVLLKRQKRISGRFEAITPIERNVDLASHDHKIKTQPLTMSHQLIITFEKDGHSLLFPHKKTESFLIATPSRDPQELIPYWTSLLQADLLKRKKQIKTQENQIKAIKNRSFLLNEELEESRKLFPQNLGSCLKDDQILKDQKNKISDIQKEFRQIESAHEKELKRKETQYKRESERLTTINKHLASQEKKLERDLQSNQIKNRQRKRKQRELNQNRKAQIKNLREMESASKKFNLENKKLEKKFQEQVKNYEKKIKKVKQEKKKHLSQKKARSQSLESELLKITQKLTHSPNQLSDILREKSWTHSQEELFCALEAYQKPFLSDLEKKQKTLQKEQVQEEKDLEPLQNADEDFLEAYNHVFTETHITSKSSYQSLETLFRRIIQNPDRSHLISKQ